VEKSAIFLTLDLCVVAHVWIRRLISRTFGTRETRPPYLSYCTPHPLDLRCLHLSSNCIATNSNVIFQIFEKNEPSCTRNHPRPITEDWELSSRSTKYLIMVGRDARDDLSECVFESFMRYPLLPSHSRSADYIGRLPELECPKDARFDRRHWSLETQMYITHIPVYSGTVNN